MVSNRTGRFCAVVALMFVCMFGGSSTLAAQQQPPAAGVTQPKSAAEDMRRGIIDGTAAADSTSTRGWAVGGFFSWVGSIFGLVGVPMYAANGPVPVPDIARMRLVEESAAYQLSYERAYVSTLRAKRLKATFKGMATGLATLASGALLWLIIATTDGDPTR